MELRGTTRAFIGLGAGLLAVSAAALFLVGSASSLAFGVSVLKDCTTPINVGDSYACEFEISNTVQTSHNTVTVTQLQDHVFAAVPPPDLILPINSATPGLILAGGASCDATKCTIPFGGSLTTSFISHYTVQVADFPAVADRGTFTWKNSCNVVTAGCNSTINNSGQATAQASINPLQTTTVTAVHNAAHQVVTAVAVGSTVHDFVTVADVLPNEPAPTGNVNVDWFLNGDCSGTPASSSGPLGPLDASGQFDATTFAFAVNSPGMRAFRANYLGGGGGAFLPSTGACEPLQVVDANIQISPLQATNPVGTNHTLTGHVNVNSGSGFVDAPDGTTINFAIQSGPGSFVGSVNTCNTAGGTGSCSVQITSAISGTTVVRASTDVTVAGVSLHRATADGLPGDSVDAQKLWQQRDANIQISPLTATNEIGTNHTLTGHVNVDTGSGFGNAPDGTTINFSIVSGPGSFVGGVSSCNTAGGTGSCAVQISATTSGTTVVKAATDVTVLGVSLHRETADGLPGDSANAQKDWVDASVAIASSATNEVGHAHTFTITVTAIPAGAAPVSFGAITPSVSPAPTSQSNTCGSPTVVANVATCTLTINNSTAGTFTANATAQVTMGGVTVTRDTDPATAAIGHGPGGSDSATKTFVDASVAIASSATNEVGHAHTFTITVTAIPAGAAPVSFGAITPSVSPAPTSQSNTCGSPTVVANVATCTLTINNSTAGTFTANATAQVTMGGVTVTRDTDPATAAIGHGPGGSDSATKTFVDASVAIASSATNEVGHAHTFTITVTAIPAGAAPVSFGAITPSVSPAPTSQSNTCGSPTVVANVATCTLTINNSTAGTFTANATAQVTMGGVTVTRDTDPATAAIGHGPGGSDSATKTFVDANIAVNPQNASNPVGTNHTFTVTVQKNLGLGGGFVAAAAEHVTFSIVNSGGATATVNTTLSTCDDAGANTDAAGQCTIVISSPTAGTTKAFAAVTLSVGSVSLTRDADSTTAAVGHGPGGTDEAAKTWVAAPSGQIAPTQATCQDFIGGTAGVLGQINYSVTGAGKIANGINPGVFFFYSKITTTVPNQVVTVTQSNNSTNNAALFAIRDPRLYTGNCSSFTAGSGTSGSVGSFTVPTPGTYIISIKYDTKSIAGTPGPVPADITYTFTTSLGGTTGATVLLKKG